VEVRPRGGAFISTIAITGRDRNPTVLSPLEGDRTALDAFKPRRTGPGEVSPVSIPKFFTLAEVNKGGAPTAPGGGCQKGGGLLVGFPIAIRGRKPNQAQGKPRRAARTAIEGSYFQRVMDVGLAARRGTWSVSGVKPGTWGWLFRGVGARVTAREKGQRIVLLVASFRFRRLGMRGAPFCRSADCAVVALSEPSSTHAMLIRFSGGDRCFIAWARWHALLCPSGAEVRVGSRDRAWRVLRCLWSFS